MAKERVSLAEATDIIMAAFTANGVPDASARSVATALVSAETEGQVGHGFSRIDDYVAQVRTGKINATSEPSVRRVRPTTITVNAEFGFAYPAMDLAIEAGAETAQEFGSSTMSVTHSHHCGALSIQVEKLARRGLVGIMVANSPAAIAPWGAKTPVFGTNPIAFAAPRPNDDPLVIDLSLSRVARGKVLHARKSGESIPEGWALDRDGKPTTDPEAALAGTMLPIGGAKGTALALIVEVLASVVPGASLSSEASSFFAAEGPPPNVGQFFFTFAPENPAMFGEQLERLLSSILALEGTRLPGSRRGIAIAKAKSEGLDVPVEFLARARALASGEA